MGIDTMKFLDFLRKSFLSLCIGLCLGGCGFAIYHKHYDSAFTWGIALVYAIGWRLEVSTTSKMRREIEFYERTSALNETMVEIARNKVVELEKKLVDTRGDVENGAKIGK